MSKMLFYINRGENHSQWKGGKLNQKQNIRNSVEYKNWRTIIYKRDNYKCQMPDCSSNSNFLEVII